ncbi:hypothetical protein EYF80_055735 [Liparis tanakae]|uniref:Uncharacterized protein n=1 Tax=Liparis tanakae TaxID=230148 RepID=A0A4Z2EYZ3_9TELE|nr:hypothetical protein EYF80_055735 [Liparis tanakae]
MNEVLQEIRSEIVLHSALHSHLDLLDMGPQPEAPVIMSPFDSLVVRIQSESNWKRTFVQRALLYLEVGAVGVNCVAVWTLSPFWLRPWFRPSGPGLDPQALV